jgi:hypothetical protein
MRISDILNEAVVISDLIEQASKLIPVTMRGFVRKQIDEWTRLFTADRREQLGYGRYDDTIEEWKRSHHGKPPSFKPFDEYDFSEANWKAGWSATDQIGDKFDTLVPKEGNSPVYAAMGAVSKVLTKLVQDYVRQKFGDPIVLQDKNAIPVADFKVQVWWTHMGDDSYGGIYRARAGHANGPETRLEVIVNRDLWRDYLIEAIVDEINEAANTYDEFSESIINVFAHEYEHLEQDIKGQKRYPFSYLPQRQKNGKMRRYSANAKAGSLEYFARPAEIDAFATGAAAQVAERLMRNYGPMADDKWNEMIMDATGDSPPFSEYYDYVLKINDLLPQSSMAKAKILKKIKQRFLRTYVNRLRSYLR